MEFDFRARANARREALEAEQRLKEEQEAALAGIAEKLRSHFESFANEYRKKSNLVAQRSGTSVTFTDGPKKTEVRVVLPTEFDVSTSRPSAAFMPSTPERRRIRGEEPLMDYLDDWLSDH